MTPAGHQIAMQFTSADRHSANDRWLGLIVDHRTLFEALSDGWLRPPRHRAGILAGIESYALERVEEPIGNRISVRVKLQSEGLPNLDGAVLRNGQWVPLGMHDIEPSDQAIYWPGVLPTFALSELTVSTQEERRRLVQLTRVASNLDLQKVPVHVTGNSDEIFEPSVFPPEMPSELEVPNSENAIHGALSMAVWAVPRMAAWLDLLMASLGPDRGRLVRSARALEAPWWRFPPWRPPTAAEHVSCPQECLWLAAIEVLRGGSSEDIGRVRDLADRIAAAASRSRDPNVESVIGAWRESTQRALRGQTEVSIEDWRTEPVGVALQLVLTRPRPISFKGWFKQRPDLPPAVAWSAAALCGLLFGYRELDTEFRGGTAQQRVLSIYSLHQSCSAGRKVDWPTITDARPCWRNIDGVFVLSWGGRDFAQKRAKARERWIASNFKDERVLREATQAAKQLNWPCVNREINLVDQSLSIRGPGNVRYVSSPSQLAIEGSVQVVLPEDTCIEDRLDIEAFKQLVAVERGLVPEPPPAVVLDRREEPLNVPGLVYRHDFLSRSEEERLVAMIDSCDWEAESLARRVQHYGWRYSYRTRKVDTSMHLGQLPTWAGEIAERLVAEGLLNELPDQAIVNEYRENQGISKHVDHKEHFADGIAMISLLEPWEMIFRGPGGDPKVGRVLDRGSVAAMHGDARYLWTHEIPRRKNEPGLGRRHRRISLTFRRVLPG